MPENSSARDAHLERILSFDPLDTAETILGRFSVYDDVTALGMLFGQQNSAAKEKALTASDDSYMGMLIEDYLPIVERLGFELVLEDKFAWREYDSDQTSTQYVFAHRDGILLSFNTYDSGTEHSVNGGNYYYSWTPNEKSKETWGLLSSGGWNGEGPEWFWTGDHDCREAIAYRIGRLRAEGKFLPVWHENRRPWLVHFSESKQGEFDMDRYDKIIADRIARLPDWVKTMIGR